MAKQDWPDWDVYVRDGCCCVYCGLDGTDIKSWRQLQIDHLIPCCAGGSESPENKVVACADCNRKKHGFDPSGGNKGLLLSADGRAELIARAKRHIESKQRIEEADYRQMMKEILG